MTSTTRVLLTSDWHIAASAWRGRPSVTGDALFSLRQIVDYAVTHAVDAVLAAGDLYDVVRPQAADVCAVHTQLTRLQQADIPLLFIQGQHERSPGAPWLAAHPWPLHCHGRTVQVNELRIFGCDWLPADKLAEFTAAHAAELRDADLVMLHQVWEEHMGGGHIVCEGRYSDLPVRQLLTGDYHQHQCVTTVNSAGAPLTVWSPGAMCLQAINEPDEKSFFDVVFRDGAVLTSTSVPLRTRPVLTFTVQTPQELEGLEAGAAELQELLATAQTQRQLPEELRAGLLAITFRDDIPHVHARLEALARSLGCSLFPFPVSVGRPSVALSDELRRNLYAEGVAAAVAALRPAADAVARDALRLLTAGDAGETLAELRVQWLGANGADQSA